MHLPLTPEEYRRLVLLASLGEAVLNDWTPDKELTGEHRAAADLLYDLYARGEDEPCIEAGEQPGTFVPAPDLAEEIHQKLHMYDNDVFWDELVHRFVHRDLVAEYGEEALDQMSDAYLGHAHAPLLDYYWREIRQHGLSRLSVQDGQSLQPDPRRRDTSKRRNKRPRKEGKETE